MSKTKQQEEQQEGRPIVRCPKNGLFLESESSSVGGRGVWYARVPADHTIEDVLRPEYFGYHQAEKGGVRTGDLIDIEPEHGLWRVQLRVMALLPALSQVKTREHRAVRENYEVKAPTGYAFAWKGDRAKWAILRGDIEVDAGFTTQDEALGRIQELQREKAA